MKKCLIMIPKPKYMGPISEKNFFVLCISNKLVFIILVSEINATPLTHTSTYKGVFFHAHVFHTSILSFMSPAAMH